MNISEISHASVQKNFTADDLYRFGDEYALEYRFHEKEDINYNTILEGRVSSLRSQLGMNLVHSTVNVITTYESSSLDPAPLLLIAMIQGNISLKLGSQPIELKESTAITLQLSKESVLEALQVSGQYLNVITLSLSYEAIDHLKINLGSGQGYGQWKIPSCLIQGIRLSQKRKLSSLMLEGLGLQLLAYGLENQNSEETCIKKLTPSERGRLEQIRSLLAACPEQTPHMTDLAEQAAMSPSSLRSKFKSCYGESLYSYLKRCRLDQAHDLLLEGYGVQQVAHRVGYTQASNFITAFRSHFGYAPGRLHR